MWTPSGVVVPVSLLLPAHPISLYHSVRHRLITVSSTPIIERQIDKRRRHVSDRHAAPRPAKLRRYIPLATVSNCYPCPRTTVTYVPGPYTRTYGSRTAVRPCLVYHRDKPRSQDKPKKYKWTLPESMCRLVMLRLKILKDKSKMLFSF